jgi:dihydrofolate reductase
MANILLPFIFLPAEFLWRRNMQKLIVFSHVTLDGYFVDINGDMSWAKADPNDAEWNAFVAENAGGGAMLVFGRITYEMMASFWPTPTAIKMMPVVAERMNNLPKVVFSRTMDKASWNNTMLVKGDLAAEMRKMKKASGEGMAILGSGSIVSQLTQEGLIDECQIVVNPLVLGKGRTMFDGIKEKLSLKLTKTRAFGNGNVLLCYEPLNGMRRASTSKNILRPSISGKTRFSSSSIWAQR